METPGQVYASRQADAGGDYQGSVGPWGREGLRDIEARVWSQGYS